jgi:hypothetical protein
LGSGDRGPLSITSDAVHVHGGQAEQVGEFDLSLPEILGVCLEQVDDASLEQRACSFAWTEYDATVEAFEQR